MLYDVFISYASEDRENLVEPLVLALQESHIEVWYDEFSLQVGDSLRRSIDKGLSQSRFGIVILSPSFFNKEWPQKELDALTSIEVNKKAKTILPIWHNLKSADLITFSPTLADKKALSSSKGIEYLSNQLKKVIKPYDSPLIVARDMLLDFNVETPVVTDVWWLDIVEASNRINNFGFAIPQQSTWGIWSFPLPYDESRGELLAWTALQLQWIENAENLKISQMSKPELVHEFIQMSPGLSEMCHKYPHFLATYAPQLTIPGFSGEFEGVFNELLGKSVSKHTLPRKQKSVYGSGLTTTKLPPICNIYIALREENLGEYKSVSIAGQYVNGEMGGPHPVPEDYQNFDYIVWLLSKESNWLPEKIHNALIIGIKDWGVWWTSYERNNSPIPELTNKISRIKNKKKFKLTKSFTKNIQEAITESLEFLEISDDVSRIYDSFIENKFIEALLESKRF